jgi:hypothetical protein
VSGVGLGAGPGAVGFPLARVGAGGAFPAVQVVVHGGPAGLAGHGDAWLGVSHAGHAATGFVRRLSVERAGAR